MHPDIYNDSAVRFLPFNSLCFINAKPTHNSSNTWDFDTFVRSLCNIICTQRTGNRCRCWNDSANGRIAIESIYATLVTLKYYLQLPHKEVHCQNT